MTRRTAPVAVAAAVVLALTVCASDGDADTEVGATTRTNASDDPADEQVSDTDLGGGPTSLAAGDPDAEPSGTGDVCWSATPDGGDGIEFADVTADAGLVDPLTGMYGHAAAIADVDGDGWTDLFVAGFADRPDEDYQVRGADGPSPDRLLMGGEAGFTLDEDFPGQLARTSGATFADLDGDGDLDLVATRNPRGDDEIGERATVVYENTGDGWEVGEEFADEVGGRSVAAIDIDRDGLLDLAIAGDRFGAGPSRLFRNVGDLEFVDATAEWGMPTDVETLALAAVDVDGDGWADLVFSGDRRMLLGGEDGFTVAEVPQFEWDVFGEEDDPAGVAVGDLDRDGRPDVVVGHHFNSTVDDGREVPVRIFLNRSEEGAVEFDEVTEESGSPALWTKSPHVAVADVDNDGHLDVVTSAVTSSGDPLVLRNTAEAEVHFEAVGEPGDGAYWVTGATDDFDHDGRLDTFMVAWEPASESPLFGNRSGAGHWVEVAVPGTDSVVDVTTGADDSVRRSWSQSTTGYAAGAAPTVRFGLGDHDGDVQVTVGDDSMTVPADSHVAVGGC